MHQTMLQWAWIRKTWVYQMLAMSTHLWHLSSEIQGNLQMVLLLLQSLINSLIQYASVKHRRGRPKGSLNGKTIAVRAQAQVSVTTSDDDICNTSLADADGSLPKRGPGRPKKVIPRTITTLTILACHLSCKLLHLLLIFLVQDKPVITVTGTRPTHPAAAIALLFLPPSVPG